jgi:hypothetical protein
MGGKAPCARGEAARTACGRVLVRGSTDEETGEVLSPAVVAERVGWCAGLARGMAAPAVPAMLVLAACDRQQATIERHPAGPRRALLRVQLPARPDPRGHRDQGAHAASLTPVRRPHKARGAALGAGFHLHAHATPPRAPDPSSPAVPAG